MVRNSNFRVFLPGSSTRRRIQQAPISWSPDAAKKLYKLHPLISASRIRPWLASLSRGSVRDADALHQIVEPRVVAQARMSPHDLEIVEERVRALEKPSIKLGLVTPSGNVASSPEQILAL